MINIHEKNSRIHFQQQDVRFKGNFEGRLFRTLKIAYQPFKFRILILLFIGLIGRFVLLLNTNLIGYWVDSYCQASECKPLPSWISQWKPQDYIQIILWLCFIGFIFTWIFRVFFSRTSAVAISRIYDEVTFRTSRYPLSFFDTTPAGRIITRFSSDYGNVFRLFGGPLAEFIALIFDLIVMVVLITFASPFYLILVGIIVLCNFVIYRWHRDGIRKERRELSLGRSPSIAHFAETAQGASTIRTYLRQSAFQKRFQSLNDLFLNQRMRTFKKMTFFTFQISALTSALLLITGISSYFLLEWHWISVGSIGVAFTFITLSGNTVQTFFEWLSQLDEALVGAERLDHYLHLPLEQGERLPIQAEFPTQHWTMNEPPPCKKLQEIKIIENAEIKFQDLYFRYRDDLPMVLKNINLQIKAGEHVGIIGRTGSGKSSLINTLFYLYPLTKGIISIDDFTPYLNSEVSPTDKQLNLFDYRQLITLIPQDPILFRGSLRENLIMLNTQINNETLILNLNRVGLSDWYKNLPKGLDHTIEERGKNLSQGEKQLLCMARCLLHNAPVIIMDEATSSVDPQSENIMVQATQNFFSKKTQIIIAHRLSTLERCHRILWLQNGEINAFGDPAEVLPKFLTQHKHEVIY